MTTDAGIKNLAHTNLRLHAKVAQLEKGMRDLVRRIGALECPPAPERIWPFDAPGPVRRGPGRSPIPRGRGSNHNPASLINSSIVDPDFDKF